MKLLNKYSLFMNRRPLIGSLLTGGLLTFVGDANIQILFKSGNEAKVNEFGNGKPPNFDFSRSFQAMVIGTVPMAISLYFWNFKMLPWFFLKFHRIRLIQKFPNLFSTVISKLLFDINIGFLKLITMLDRRKQGLNNKMLIIYCRLQQPHSCDPHQQYIIFHYFKIVPNLPNR